MKNIKKSIMSLIMCTPLCCSQVPEKGDLDAKHYRENSQLQFLIAQDPLTEYPFIGDELVLDVGCGDGKITAQVAKRVSKGGVIGLDKSPSMINLARESFPEELHTNLKFEIGDINSYACENHYDLIISFSCMHWMKDQIIALKKIKQLLKPSGKAIILTFPRCPSFWDPIESVTDSPKWKKYFENNPRPYHFLNEDDYYSIAEDLGLKILESKTSSHVAKFQGKKGFQDYVRGWLPFLIDLPNSLHDELLEEIGTKSLEYIPLDVEGYVNHPYDKITLIFE